MSIYILAFLIGAVTGLRALAPAAVVSWAAHVGWLHLQGTWLAFLGAAFSPYILSILALVELITDKLPSTPSRKIPMQFGARIVMGALSGAALAASGGEKIRDRAFPWPSRFCAAGGATIRTRSICSSAR